MSPPITVLESFSGIYPTTNPYIAQLAQAFHANDDLKLVTFSWRRALLGRYDVFHVHWPEQLMGGHKATGRAARRLLTALLCLRLWLGRAPIVRTWHNVERPRGLARLDYRLLDMLDRLTVLRIRLNEVSDMPREVPYETILLGDYRDWYRGCIVAEPVPGRIGYVGLIRGYKGVEDLIAAFRETEDERLSLLVAGNPTSAELKASVTLLASGDPRIITRLEYLDDRDFVEALTSSELVALPYRAMHNSSAVLAALSLDRPVLVPDNEVNRLLADEVGRGWVHFYRDVLDAQALLSALDAVRAPRDPHPDLSLRGWDRVAADHARAFRRAVRLKRGRRTVASEGDW